MESLVVNSHCYSAHVTLKIMCKTSLGCSNTFLYKADHYLGLITKMCPFGCEPALAFLFSGWQGAADNRDNLYHAQVNLVCLIKLILKLVMAFQK